MMTCSLLSTTSAMAVSLCVGGVGGVCGPREVEMYGRGLLVPVVLGGAVALAGTLVLVEEEFLVRPFREVADGVPQLVFGGLATALGLHADVVARELGLRDRLDGFRLLLDLAVFAVA